jgi:adenylate cyclase
MLRLARALYDRRVPHALGIYLAAGWGLLEFTSWAADRALVGEGFVNVLLAFGILGLPFTAYLAWRSGGEARPAVDDLDRAGTDTASVAVLPFVNRSASEEDAFLSDGITDEITTALARTPGLRVASRTSAYVFKGQTQDIRSIGRALNVRAVLEGSVQRADDRIRVTTQLVDVGDGYQLWSGRYDREFSDLFAIEDEIAGQVVDVLRVLLNQKGQGGHRKVPRADIRAYQHYLRGRQFFYQARRKSLHFARQLFRTAIEIDPDYALAHAALADTISLERTYYPNSDADLEEAERASRRALELDPGLAEAHGALAFVLFMTGRLAEAETEFRTAISLDPRIADARYFFARMRFQQGRMEEAARLFREAADLREDHDAAFFAGQALEALGEEDAAVVQYRRAVKAGEDHMDLNPDDARAATIRAVALYRVGREAEGLEWGERAVEIDPHDAGVRYNVACLFAVADQRDRAIELIVEAVDAGFGNREWLERDPDLGSIRDDPRFQAVLEHMGQVESRAADRQP